VSTNATSSTIDRIAFMALFACKCGNCNLHYRSVRPSAEYRIQRALPYLLTTSKVATPTRPVFDLN
jgi:hypothetical protein